MRLWPYYGKGEGVRRQNMYRFLCSSYPRHSSYELDIGQSVVPVHSQSRGSPPLSSLLPSQRQSQNHPLKVLLQRIVQARSVCNRFCEHGHVYRSLRCTLAARCAWACVCCCSQATEKFQGCTCSTVRLRAKVNVAHWGIPWMEDRSYPPANHHPPASNTALHPPSGLGMCAS